MDKEAAMAHTVEFSLPPRQLGRADVEFKVKKDGDAFGTLKVSKGAVVWVPRDAVFGYRLGWVKLNEIMRAQGKHARRR